MVLRYYKIYLTNYEINHINQEYCRSHPENLSGFELI
jgi:hypothetical protein